MVTVFSLILIILSCSQTNSFLLKSYHIRLCPFVESGGRIGSQIFNKNKNADRNGDTDSKPLSLNRIYSNKLSSAIKLPLSILSLGLLSLYSSIANAETASDSLLYQDTTNNFILSIPSSFSVMKTKVPTPTLSKYQMEESLLVASNFQENASLSVTKTNVVKLLKDFNIDWWFAPLNSIYDVGTADLVAKLLIYQRQYEFEKKTSTSVISKSYFDEKDKSLVFYFTTPTNSGKSRDTVAKAYFKDNTLFVLWLSSSKSIEGEMYDTILKSFQVI